MDKKVWSIYIVSIFITSFFIGQNIQSFLSPEDHSVPPSDPELPPTEPELPPTEPELPPTEPELPPTNPSLDTKAPSVSIVSPLNENSTEIRNLLHVYAWDYNGIDKIWYNWNGRNISYTSEIYINFNYGWNTLTAWANDTSGNTQSRSVSFFIYNNYSSGPLPDYVPVAIGDVYWYNVSQSRSLAFGSEKTISKWSFEVLCIGGEMSSGIDLIVNYSKYIDNNLTEAQMKVLFIPKSKGLGEFYDASPYIFATNHFFNMTEGSSREYFRPDYYEWQSDGASFSEGMYWGSHTRYFTFITYNAGILMHFEWKKEYIFPLESFTMDLIEVL